MICDLPEHEIVRVCAGVWSGEEKSARLKDLCGPDVDWGKVFAAAKAHGVLFLLYKGLKAHGLGVPGEFLQQLKRLYLQNSAENLRVGARLVRILGVLADAGVDAVPFKGPVQAEAVYGDIGARYFCDLDILVRRDDALAARDVLVENGFFINVPISDDQAETYLRHENFFSFTDRAKSLHIDLHWELTGRYLLCPVYMEDLAGRLEGIGLAGAEFDTRGLGDKGLSWRFSPMHFLIRDSAADGLRYAARMFFTPTIREWIDYPLPLRWLFLYRVLRPWRIVSGWAVSRRK